MKHILLERPRYPQLNNSVRLIRDRSMGFTDNRGDFFEIRFDAIPEGCEVGADAIQDDDGNWTFQPTDYRAAATMQVHDGHEFDDKNFTDTHDMAHCLLIAFKALHGAQVSDSPAAIALRDCVLKIRAIKLRMDQRKAVNDTLHAIIGGESSKGSRSLLAVSRFIKEAIELVNNVSEAYGLEGLALLKSHFENSQHFGDRNQIVIPSAYIFNPEAVPSIPPQGPSGEDPAPTEEAPETIPAEGS